MNRRFFLFAAPAIVAAPSLMRVSTLPAEMASAAHTTWYPPQPGGYSSAEIQRALDKMWDDLRRQMTGISDLMYGDGSTINRRMGIGSLLTDAEHDQIAADVAAETA